jgi:hypothetical protein
MSPFILDNAVLALDQDGKGLSLYFHLKLLISLLATPKHQHGRKAQQACTVAAATTATATATVDAATTAAAITIATMATTTPAAATPAATAATIFATPTRGTVTVQAAMAITITGTSLVEDSDDPFLVTSPIHLYESSPTGQPDVNNTSEASAEHQKDSKAKQDVSTFFQHENT